MDRFDELAVLVTIVDEGSLAAAALAALEERAGARLLEQLWLPRCEGCYPNFANQRAEFGHMEASQWGKGVCESGARVERRKAPPEILRSTADGLKTQLG